MLINRQDNLNFLCDQLRAGGAPLAIDTEFISEKRYSPRLCLVQVFAEAEPEPVEALIDPFAVDMKPLLQLLADESIIKIVHAGGQDLQIFAEAGFPARHVFDTQIAAAFLGYGHQIGYADMVRRTMGGPQLNKAQQYTDWAARPLTPSQMDYALDDVRFLPAIYAQLQRDLTNRGRLQWAQSEFRRAELRAANPPTSSELYRRFNLSGLSRRQLGHLRELAVARESIARQADKPPSFIVPDATLLQLAKHPPHSLSELRATRGMPGLAQSASNELLDALERAANLPMEELPERSFSERPDARTESVAALLGTLAQLRASEQDISRAYLAPRDQLLALAAWWLRPASEGERDILPDLPLLSDWRRELLGSELLQFLNGKLGLACDPDARDKPGDHPVIKVQG